MVKRKWLGGVLGANKMIYAIPYDADVILEINPERHSMIVFGDVGNQPCKWYGGVLAPNNKIYAIPYAASMVLEIEPETKTVSPFALVTTGWGKWAGGVLAGNGKIYAMPALATTILEIDIEAKVRPISYHGMLPGGGPLDDKWNGAVLAPNGKIYGIPWRAGKVLEFDPDSNALALVGSIMTSTNFTWHGGVVTKDGRIIAVPYNSAWVLEIGESVCSTSSAVETYPSIRDERPRSAGADSPKDWRGQAEPVWERKTDESPISPVPLGTADDASTQVFVLALLGCPDAEKTSEDSCFHLSHRTWHSAMVTIMKPTSQLNEIRAQGELVNHYHPLPPQMSTNKRRVFVTLGRMCSRSVCALAHSAAIAIVKPSFGLLLPVQWAST